MMVQPARFLLIHLLLVALTLAQDQYGISENFFSLNKGLDAAKLAAPQWNFASGSCLPQAAEDGQGHQTNGADVPVVLCTAAQAGGCPDSTWKAFDTPYGRDVSGEPFNFVPTYFNVEYCAQDSTYRVGYYLYFKKDATHKSDFEWAVVAFKEQSDGLWGRAGILLSKHGDYGGGRYSDIPDTFAGTANMFETGNKGLPYPKIYVGKAKHDMHWDKEARNKNTCLDPGFRANDFQMWSYEHLRHIDGIDPAWNYGQASNPHSIDICDNDGVSF